MLLKEHRMIDANLGRDGGLRKLRVCFLFNAQRHQLLHGISIAAALSRKPGFEVVVMAPSHEHISYARALARRMGADELEFVVPNMPALDFARSCTGRSVPPKLLTLAVIAPELGHFDAIALPERTSILLKTLGLRGPSYIHLDHGAGDRAVGFDPRIRHFDFVLMAGEKHRSRMLRAGLIKEDNHAVVGYPKFDAADAAREAGWTPFPGDPRPIILYNPHFSPLGSWHKFGSRVLQCFAAQDRYNLIFAPHIRLFDGAAATARWISVLEPFRRHPRIHVDCGSDRSIDMTYTTLADVYLGDVSSQIYEFLRTPRPCLFLDAHGIDWKTDENYAHWHFGSVSGDPDRVIDLIDGAREDHGAFAQKQEEGVRKTFSVSDVSGSDRAAQAIAGHLMSRRQIQMLRRERRRLPTIKHDAFTGAVRRAAVIIPAIVGGWLLHDFLQPTAIVAAPTQFVDEAIASHKHLLLREQGRSPPKLPSYDIGRIDSRTSIQMPRLPDDWRVLDVQVLPAPSGPGVQTLIALPSGDRITLVGMRVNTPAGQQPVLDRRDNENVAYWEEGHVAFALVGRASSRLLLASAAMLSAQS